MSADVAALARTLHDYGCGIPDLCELVHRDTTPPRWTVMAQNLLADPRGLLASLADAGVLEAVEEAAVAEMAQSLVRRTRTADRYREDKDAAVTRAIAAERERDELRSRLAAARALADNPVVARSGTGEPIGVVLPSQLLAALGSDTEETHR